MVTARSDFQPSGQTNPLDYPTSDGRPMGETDLHRNQMIDAIESLKMFFEGRKVYVTGNLLLFYEPGNRRRHVSPDVMVVKDLAHHLRENYLVWEEKDPDVVIEVTSRTTRKEDVKEKFEIYRDLVKVKELFLFDPRSEYLKPPLQGHRLEGGQYAPIRALEGRIPSESLNLHLEKTGNALRFYNPLTGKWIPTFREAQEESEAKRQESEAKCQEYEAKRQESEVRRQQAERRLQEAEEKTRQAVTATEAAVAESARLRREIEALKRQGRGSR